MTVALKTGSASQTPQPVTFNTNGWLAYFKQNKEDRPVIVLPPEINLPESLRVPLVRSLQRFQIGETGDGKHLKKFAKKLGNPVYSESIDLFIREEQVHGQTLGEVILALNGTLLNWHWTDLAFILLRRLLGLKTEIFILLIAEVVGKCFYRAVSDKIENETLSDVFALIVLDEIAHLRFHSEFLSFQIKEKSWFLKCTVHYIWCLLFYSACFVFVLDHKETLLALGLTPAEFIAKCSLEFQRSAAQVFSLR